MRLDEVLFSQGFGTRRVCAGLISAGRVRLGQGADGRVCTDAAMLCAVDVPGFAFEVDGQVWPWHERAYVMLHKPAGYECSQRPGAWPSVYSLLPAPLRQRPGAGRSLGVQAVGRLDQDTTGLLLLSDDGQFLHRMAAPRWQVAKRYEAQTRHALDEEQLQRLRSGVVLRDAPRPVAALGAEVDASKGAHHLLLTLGEGKYHQVKRMVAAVGNRVEGLHRAAIGPLALPADLSPGQWRWLRADERSALLALVGLEGAGG